MQPPPAAAAPTAKRPPPSKQGKQQQQQRTPWVKKKRGADLSPQERLTHAATKEIGRELKKVKAFLLQRLVKRCRRLRGGGKKGGGEEESSADEGGSGEHESPAVQACLAEIKAVKALTAESVAPVCLRRLGLAYTGSEHAALSEAAAAPGALKQALAHPRMAALLQSLDERVTDLRRGGDGKAKKGGKKRGRGYGAEDDGEDEGGGGAPPKLARVRAKATAAYEGSSVFLDSLSGFVPQGRQAVLGRRGEADDDDGDGADGGMDVYGYREFGASAQRKNRPGQRARRAKVEAIQAAMEGKRRGGPSSNWRGERRAGAAAEGGGAGAGGGGGGRGFGGWGGGRGGGGRGEGGRGGGHQQQRDRDSRGRPPPQPGQQRQSAAAAAPKQQAERKPSATAAAAAPPAGGGGGEALHPSWAAKQAQRAKAGIGAFQGKKITFASAEDDD